MKEKYDLENTLTILKEFKERLDNFVAPPNSEGWSLSNLPTHFWEDLGECINDIEQHLKSKTYKIKISKRDCYLETDDCQAGCKFFTGAEVRHHPDCIYYPESFSKRYDDLKAKMELFVQDVWFMRVYQQQKDMYEEYKKYEKLVDLELKRREVKNGLKYLL